MTALSAEREIVKSGNLPVPTLIACPLTADGVVYKGGMVARVSADGYWDAATTSTGFVAGVAREAGDNTGGSDGDVTVLVEPGVFAMNNSSAGDQITADDLLQLCYVVDDNTVALTSNGGARPVAGVIMGVEDDGSVRVLLGLRAAIADFGAAIQKRQLVMTEADLTTAGAAQALNIGAALPANSTVLGVSIHDVTAFSGASVADMTIDVGSSGDVDALVDGADVFGAAVVDGSATMTAGIQPNKHFTASTQLIATFRCGTDDVADATAGGCTIDVLFVEGA
jgi:hypothetical protein